MAFDQRLPTVNSDDGQWGDILNQFLMKEHYNTGVDNAANGGHKTITIQPGTTGAGTAPLKFTAGPLLTSAEAGAVEFNSDKLYMTTSTPTRKTIAAYDDGSGATGDIYYRDSSGNFVRLAVGSGSQYLGVTSGLPAWKSVQLVYATTTKTTTYSVTTSDVVVLVNASGTCTMTLPTVASSTGLHMIIKKIDSSSANVVTVKGNGSETIDGANTATISVQYVALEVVCDGSAWYII